MQISYGGDWSVELTEAQYAAGKEATLKPGATHFTIWEALKQAGVPVRDGRKTPASHAATAFTETYPCGGPIRG